MKMIKKGLIIIALLALMFSEGFAAGEDVLKAQPQGLGQLQEEQALSALDLLPLEMWEQVYRHLPEKESEDAFVATCRCFHGLRDKLILNIPENTDAHALKKLLESRPGTLRQLTLKGAIRDNDLDLGEVWAKFPHLTSLDLTGCKEITDQAVEFISGMANLTSLDLSWCKQITDQAVEKLRGACPRLTITR